ncbi:MAG: hypothetical protein ACM31C_10185, partial [Acidobacteriota bacterium]
QKIVETKGDAAPAPARSKPPTAPPPIPPPRSKLPTAPPPVPAAKPAASKVTPNPFGSEKNTSVIIDDDSLGAQKLGVQKLAVPVGEFDSGVQTIESERKTPEQATVKRDAAEALLQIEPGSLRPRGDEPTAIDPSPARGERAADATEIQAPSQSQILDGKTATGGKLRSYAALRRQRGLVGDVRYVFTALFGVRSSRRELAELEHRQTVRQTSRRRHLVTLGRTAVTADAFDHAALAEAREALAQVEDERARHAAAVSAADGELDRVRRDREANTQKYAEAVTARDAELADLAKKLEPLEKEAATVRKRAQELKESLARIDKQITATEAKLVSVHIDKMDRAGIHAEIATLKADREAVQRDEPALAAELDALNPRIAAIEAARSESRKQRKELDEHEAEDKRRTAELLEAIGAKRKVVERASGEAETARDKVLFELGERLYVDRPAILGAQLSPIDQIDLELGESDRRIMELREILSNIDKAKLARGAAVIILAFALIGSFAAWLLFTLV